MSMTDESISRNDVYGRRNDDGEYDGSSSDGDTDSCIDCKAMCMAVYGSDLRASSDECSDDDNDDMDWQTAKVRKVSDGSGVARRGVGRTAGRKLGTGCRSRGRRSTGEYRVRGKSIGDGSEEKVRCVLQEMDKDIDDDIYLHDIMEGDGSVHILASHKKGRTSRRERSRFGNVGRRFGSGLEDLSGEETTDVQEEVPNVQGKSKWIFKEPVDNLQKRGTENIVREAPGPNLVAKMAKTELDTFLLFFDDEMFNVTAERTNLCMERNRERSQREDPLNC